MKVYVLGMDERSLNMLSFFFQKFCHGQCEISNQKDADVFFINMDGVNADKHLENFNKNFSTYPLITTSIRTLDMDNHYFLRKPMVADHLLTILDEIRNKLSNVKIVSKPQESVNIEVEEKEDDLEQKKSTGHAGQLLNEQDLVEFVGNKEDIDLTKSNRHEHLFFDMEASFLGIFHRAYLRAKQEKSIIKVTGMWRPITLFPNENKVYVDLTDRQLQAICVVTLKEEQRDEIKTEVIRPQAAARECKHRDNFRDLELFIWKISLWTSRGRLPKDTPLDMPVYLKCWPNFTRLIVTPYALRITAYWLSSPRTIINLADSLAIPQRYIFSLFTACYISSIAGIAKRESDILISSAKTQDTSRQNFFSRIMNKLYSKEQ